MKKSALLVALLSVFSGFAFADGAAPADDMGVKVTTDKITISASDAKIIARFFKTRRGLDWVQNGGGKINFAGTFETTNAADVIRAKAGEPLAGQCHDFGHGAFVCKGDDNAPGFNIGGGLFVRSNVILDGSKTIGRGSGKTRYTLSDVDLTAKAVDGKTWEKVADVENGLGLYRRAK